MPRSFALSDDFSIKPAILLQARVHHVLVFRPLLCFKDLVLENRGFEPLTLGLQSRCSSQLS